MKYLVLVLAALFVVSAVALTRDEIYQRAAITEVWEPVPTVVSPGASPGSPPSDAVILFDGDNLDAWESSSGEAAGWRVENDYFEVVAGAGDLRTRTHFESVQLHVEWATPAEIVGEGQGRGNSGVFLMKDYEVQVLDSFENPTYSNGQAASIYKQHIPLVNASRPPGAWQAYDIVFMAPTFSDDGRLARPAEITVFHNGVLVQNRVRIQGPTEFIGKPNYVAHGPAPIKLQDHGNPVRYRNIWVREL